MITVLSGGFGGARFARGLVDAGLDVTLVVNTADDLKIFNAYVSPDVDMCLHALAGELDEHQGWGLLGDTYTVFDGLPARDRGWFRIGDLDLGFGVTRAEWLHQGMTLTAATDALAKARGVTTTVLPMTDGVVRTMVDTPIGTLPLQEFLVLHQGAPEVLAVHQYVSDGTCASSQVLAALHDAEVVVIGPSSPVASVLPILDLLGVRDVLRRRFGPTVAVTPVVCSSAPVRRPEAFRYDIRERFLATRGVSHTPEGVASLYLDIIDGFVGDVRDGVTFNGRVGRRGEPVATVLADTLAPPGQGRVDLAIEVVGFGRAIGSFPVTEAGNRGHGPTSSSLRARGIVT